MPCDRDPFIITLSDHTRLYAADFRARQPYSFTQLYALYSHPRQQMIVSMEEKLKGLKRLDNDETLFKVAKDYNVAETTAGDWKRNHNDTRGILS
ncbi:hypothetical protein J6590_107327, partial [Homalodisca vitripennis]